MELFTPFHSSEQNMGGRRAMCRILTSKTTKMNSIDEHPEFNEIVKASCEFSTEMDEAVISIALPTHGGKLLAASTVDDEIIIIDFKTGALHCKLEGHAGGTNSLDWLSPTLLFSCGDDGRIKIWDTTMPSCLHSITAPGEEADKSPTGHTVHLLTFTADQTRCAVAAGRSAHIYSWPKDLHSSPPSIQSLPTAPSTILALRFAKDGSHLMLSHYGGATLYKFKPQQGDNKEKELTVSAIDLPYQAACLAVDSSNHGEWVVCGCHDASAHIFHIQYLDDGVKMADLSCGGGYMGKVNLVDFNKSGTWMASSGGETCVMWPFQPSPDSTIPTITVGHRKIITAQGWQPDGDLFATGSKDGRVFFYDLDHAVPGRPSMCMPGAMAWGENESDGDDSSAGGMDEVTVIKWGLDGVVFTGHVSGKLKRWQLPFNEE